MFKNTAAFPFLLFFRCTTSKLLVDKAKNFCYNLDTTKKGSKIKIKTKSIKIFEKADIKQITLLTIEQAEKMPDDILRGDDWWWLQSAGYDQEHIAGVDYDGSIDEDGYDVDNDFCAVRPAFKVTNLNFESGEKVYVEKLPCTVIDKDPILSDECICYHRFDSTSNDWKTSELKEFLESDFLWNECIEKERG